MRKVVEARAASVTVTSAKVGFAGALLRHGMTSGINGPRKMTGAGKAFWETEEAGSATLASGPGVLGRAFTLTGLILALSREHFARAIALCNRTSLHIQGLI